jgi:hypothetical protein
LLAGDFESAREDATRVLQFAETFSEAYLVRAMAHLGLGDYAGSIEDAHAALRLFERGMVDERAWGDTPSDEQVERGRLIANRTICVARAATGAEDFRIEDAGTVFSLFYAVSNASSCTAARQHLDAYKNEWRVLRVMNAALGSCQNLWSCHGLIATELESQTES